MLFPYTFIPHHSIYTLQEWMDDLFLNVWCTADPTVDFDINLLPEDLIEITLAIYNDARITKDYLYGPIERVYIIFQGFNQATKNALAQAYSSNNSIEDLCKNQNGCNPYLYTALQVVNAPLRMELEKFYKSLFTDIIHLKVVQDKIGKIDDHYDLFVTTNDERKCPFCGLNSIKGPNRTVRDAYDHYLPKDVYPFNSINFRNLAPMCHECNSSHKLRQDPITNPLSQVRRHAFYPYDTNNHYQIDITIGFNHTDIDTLTENDITVTLSSATHQAEVDTWSAVFAIEERYKEKCASKTEGKYWYIQATDEYQNALVELGAPITQTGWIQRLINEANRNKYAAGNFIKSQYLVACKANGILP